MKPRITLSLTAEGLLEIFVNETGRDQLVKELQHLSIRSDHFHFGPSEHDEVQVRSRAYKPGDTLIEYGKVLFRPDEWDERYYPHVLNDG